MIKVCKFGGTSMADAKAMSQAKNIIESDASRRFVVVSAPGKRFKDDIKITDMLYKCNNEVLECGSCEKSFSLIKARFIEIVKDLGIDLEIEEILNETQEAIEQNKSADFAASRGEYLSARILACALGYEFLDATEIIRFDSKGNFNDSYSDDKMKTKLCPLERVVVPGFYGKNSYGNGCRKQYRYYLCPLHCCPPK